MPALTPDQIERFARRGAHVEITAYQLWHQPDLTDELLVETARAAGDRLILTSDGGQVTTPPPAEALAMLADRLAGLGISRQRLDDACSTVPRALFLPRA